MDVVGLLILAVALPMVVFAACVLFFFARHFLSRRDSQ
jgi:ATP/ADP translocase